MKRGKQVPSRTKRQQKKRRWWHYLDLVLIVVLLNVLVFAAQLLPAMRTLVTTTAALAQQTPLVGSYTGLNAIAVPLEKIVAQMQQQPQQNCTDPKLSQAELQKCLEGTGSSGTYTGDKPKIQNPIAKGSSLFFFTPPDITVDNPNITGLWKFVMGVVDILLAVVLMLNGVRIILTGSVFRYSRVIEELPGVLLALVVAHVSLTFTTVIIGVNNTMTSSLYTFAEETPGIQRSHSGFGAGDTKEYTLRLFFPSASKGDEKKFESQQDISPQEAAKKWPGPEAPNDNTSSTSKDLKQFTKDTVCTVEQVNFDAGRRSELFGDGKGSVNQLRGYLSAISAYMIREVDQGQGSMTDAERTKLKGMADQMGWDIDHIAENPLKWYNDWKDFKNTIEEVGNKLTYHIPTNYQMDQSDLDLKVTTLLFAGVGAYANSEPDYRGDGIKYACQNDATGSDFQLVPNDLNFTDLFKDLQDLTNILKTVTKLMALMLLGQMVIRLFFINLYIVVAPLGIACWALPGKVGQPVARTWLQGFISIVLVQFVMAAAVIVTQILLGEIIAFTGGGDHNHVAGGLSSETLANIVHIACLWFVFRIPSLLQSAPLRSMSEAGQMMTQAVGMTISMHLAQIQMVTQVGMMGVQGGMGAFGGGRLSRGIGTLRGIGR